MNQHNFPKTFIWIFVACIFTMACSHSDPIHENQTDADQNAHDDSDITSDSFDDADVTDDADTPDDGDAPNDSDFEDDDADISDDGDVPDADPDVDPDVDFDEDRSGPLGPCEVCEVHDSCLPGAYCVSITDTLRTCIEGCDPEFLTCPRGFDCVVPPDSDLDIEVCFPEEGAWCCIDEDGDHRGRGVGCVDVDCDDSNADVYPGAPELCNGISDDCDDEIDESPTDCWVALCRLNDDGEWEYGAESECRDGECVIEPGWLCSSRGCDAHGCIPPHHSGCTSDAHCADGAHCSSGGTCQWDLELGERCERDRECEDRRCVDDRCCDSACGGECESCDNADGECRPSPEGEDPAGECRGFSCASYYAGFDDGGACHVRADVADDSASCDGTRSCQRAEDLCPASSVGEIVLTCEDGTHPIEGTCVGTNPGECG